MPVIFKYLQDFYQKDFRLFYFLLVLVLLAVLLYFNYGHGLEKKYAAGSNSKWGRFWGYYLLYLTPFALAFFLQLLFYKDCSYYKNLWFWIILLLAPAFFSFRVNFDFHHAFIAEKWSGDKLLFWTRTLNLIVKVFVLLIPVVAIWWIKDSSEQPFYGSAPLTNIKPYLWMLLIMVPLIALACTQNDFLQMYPKAKMLDKLDLPSKPWYYILYELSYGFDFISIEFFFRGFLILSLARICGPQCIIPVACFYCAIHLGKPLGEAISSFWGGLLLGIISYNTNSIWGGLIVHLGIAWLMETGSWISSLVKTRS